jgi:hypothetical protein
LSQPLRGTFYDLPAPAAPGIQIKKKQQTDAQKRSHWPMAFATGPWSPAPDRATRMETYMAQPDQTPPLCPTPHRERVGNKTKEID